MAQEKDSHSEDEVRQDVSGAIVYPRVDERQKLVDTLKAQGEERYPTIEALLQELKEQESRNLHAENPASTTQNVISTRSSAMSED
jgi:hypothetical protein